MDEWQSGIRRGHVPGELCSNHRATRRVGKQPRRTTQRTTRRLPGSCLVPIQRRNRAGSQHAGTRIINDPELAPLSSSHNALFSRDDQEGDLLEVTESYGNGWLYGRHCLSGLWGQFPEAFVRRDDQ